MGMFTKKKGSWITTIFLKGGEFVLLKTPMAKKKTEVLWNYYLRGFQSLSEVLWFRKDWCKHVIWQLFKVCYLFLFWFSQQLSCCFCTFKNSDLFSFYTLWFAVLWTCMTGFHDIFLSCRHLRVQSLTKYDILQTQKWTDFCFEDLDPPEAFWLWWHCCQFGSTVI